MIWIDIKYRADATPERYSDNIKGELHYVKRLLQVLNTQLRLMLDAFKKPHLRATSWFPGGFKNVTYIINMKEIFGLF